MSEITQSTRHIMMIEPADFYANPQTMETNVYQIDKNDVEKDIYSKALSEFRVFRDLLVAQGVIVTTAYGHKDCPDMVFPNWASTHIDGKMVIYPMLNENRRSERVPEIINFLKKMYPDVLDLSSFEKEGKFLEARGSIVCDRVNKVGYAALSARTSEEMVVKWGELMGYEMVIFNTQSHTGHPVYHTDLVMYIGTKIAAICLECIDPSQRDVVAQKLRATHEVVELSSEQLQNFCGNALEVRGHYNDPYLATSEAAYNALNKSQKDQILSHVKDFIFSPLPTLEKYGGGSARCTLMELY